MNAVEELCLGVVAASEARNSDQGAVLVAKLHFLGH